MSKGSITASRAAPLRNIIEAGSMSHELQEQAMETAALLLRKAIPYAELEAAMKNAFDKTYGPNWDCFAGHTFVFYDGYRPHGSTGEHWTVQNAAFIYFSIGETAILLRRYLQ